MTSISWMKIMAFNLPMFTILDRTVENEIPFLTTPKWKVLGEPEPKTLLVMPGQPPPKPEMWGYAPTVLDTENGRYGCLWVNGEGLAEFAEKVLGASDDAPGAFQVLPIPDGDTLRRVMKFYEQQQITEFLYHPLFDSPLYTKYKCDSIPRMLYSA